jgi:translocation and assembly module TamA
MPDLIKFLPPDQYPQGPGLNNYYNLPVRGTLVAATFRAWLSAPDIPVQGRCRSSSHSSDPCPPQAKGISLRCLSLLCVLIVFVVLQPGFTAALRAAEPVAVVIKGVEGDVLKNVQEALALPAGLISNGKADRLWLERFVSQAQGKIHLALQPFGYYNARVNVRLETGKAEEYRVLVNVETGEPVRITALTVSLTGPGAGEEPLQKLAAAFPLQKDGILLQQTYEKAKDALQLRAQELGYLDAEYPVHEIRIARDALSARIELILKTGEKYYFDGVKIVGAPDYPDAFLRRYLTFRSGEYFSAAKMAESQLNLNNSERFREVIVTAQKQEAEGANVPVLIQLKPGPRRSLRPGIGYGTDTGGRFTLRYRDLNMLHEGHEFYSNLYISERLQGLAAGYVLPSSGDFRSNTSLQLNLQQEDVTVYKSQLISLELARNHSFGKEKLGTAYIRLQEEGFTIGLQNSSSRVVLPGLRLAGNYYDNMVRPTHGFLYSGDLRGTHQILGSDTYLLQFITSGSYILPLPWRLSVHARMTAGITIFSDAFSELPPSLRFFAGGDQSVRGYSYQSLGPLDAQGQVVGGKNLLTGSVELERAVFEKWGVSVFYDAGNAFDSFNGLTLFQGAGVGLHYYTPVGALNLSLARQIGVDNPGYYVHFTVGFEL